MCHWKEIKSVHSDLHFRNLNLFFFFFVACALRVWVIPKHTDTGSSLPQVTVNLLCVQMIWTPTSVLTPQNHKNQKTFSCYNQFIYNNNVWKKRPWENVERAVRICWSLQVYGDLFNFWSLLRQLNTFRVQQADVSSKRSWKRSTGYD